MRYFVTGITGTVVPVIVEDLMKKDQAPVFYFAIRKDAKGNGIRHRFVSVIDSMDLDNASNSMLYRIQNWWKLMLRKITRIAPDLYAELIANTDKILHGAAVMSGLISPMRKSDA
ncbi:MAG: SDR family oxidoreductase [Desulfobacterales bacterium]